jgi:hypothetical protein
MAGMKPLDINSIGQGANEKPQAQSPAEPKREPGRVFSAKDLGAPSPEAQEASRLSSFPSREPRATKPPARVMKSQINAYMMPDAADAFKDLCERERYSYGDMIEIMLKFYLENRK